tara:strand:- start:814 stop:2253 length:1440 start_codon:yes stop_codon:yes gene_type:complete
MSRKRTKDRHVSGTGRRDNDKRQGGGSFAWGRLGAEASAEDSKATGSDPNNASGGFAAHLEQLCAKGGLLTSKDTANPVFALGVMVGMRARQQGKACGAWVAQTVAESNTVSSDGSSLVGTPFEAAFQKCDGFSNIDGFVATQGVDQASSPPVVFLARESDKVVSRFMREGALACGCEVIDIGVRTSAELSTVVAEWNSAPWTDAKGLENALAKAQAQAQDEVGEEAPAAPATKEAPPAEEKTAAQKYAERKAAQDELKAQKELEARMAAMDISQFTVYDDDACLQKPAPSLASLEFVHMEPADYKQGGITAVVFWGKFAKGDYTTVITWSELAEKYPDVQFIGVSLDAKKADAEKYVGKIGTFMATQGKNGITIAGGFPLAFDPDRKVKDEFKKLSAIMALSVGMAYLVKDGKVQWREQFTRGESPMNQFEGQLKRLVAGEAVELKNGIEPEEEESDDDDDEEGGTVNVAISAAGADY